MNNISRSSTEKEIIKLAKDCNMCGHCCSMTSGFILKKELKNISKELNITINELKKKYIKEIKVYDINIFRPILIKKGKPYGKCIFFKNKKCQIHNFKPLFCKIATCKSIGDKLVHWYMLNYVIDISNPESIRQWSQSIRCEGTIPGGKPEELICDKELLKKIMNYEVLR